MRLLAEQARKATPAVLNEPRASPRGRNSERNLGEKFHTGCAGQATLTRGSTTGNVRYPGFLAEDLVLALPNANTIGLWARFHYPAVLDLGVARMQKTNARCCARPVRGLKNRSDMQAALRHAHALFEIMLPERRLVSALCIRGCVREGYVREGCVREGYVREGYDREGYDRELNCMRGSLLAVSPWPVAAAGELS